MEKWLRKNVHVNVICYSHTNLIADLIIITNETQERYDAVSSEFDIHIALGVSSLIAVAVLVLVFSIVVLLLLMSLYSLS